MRMLKVTLSLCAGIFVTVFFGGAWYFSSVILYPRAKPCNQRLYVYCGKPSELKLPYREVELKASDGVKLKAWWMPSTKPSNKAVVFVHGRGGSRNIGMRYATMFHQAGFHMFALDLRRFGQSQRVQSTMGYHEQKDVTAAINFVASQKGVQHIGVFAFSMGASTSMMVMAKDKRIQAGVFEGPFASAERVLIENAKSRYGLPKYPLIPMVFQLVNWRAKIDLSAVNPLAVIAKIAPRAVYIIHHEGDHQVPIHHGRELFQAAKQPKLFWELKGKGHVNAWQKKKKKAEGSVLAFFQKYLK